MTLRRHKNGRNKTQIKYRTLDSFNLNLYPAALINFFATYSTLSASLSYIFLWSRKSHIFLITLMSNILCIDPSATRPMEMGITNILFCPRFPVNDTFFVAASGKQILVTIVFEICSQARIQHCRPFIFELWRRESDLVNVRFRSCSSFSRLTAEKSSGILIWPFSITSFSNVGSEWTCSKRIKNITENTVRMMKFMDGNKSLFIQFGKIVRNTMCSADKINSLTDPKTNLRELIL